VIGFQEVVSLSTKGYFGGNANAKLSYRKMVLGCLNKYAERDQYKVLK